jgi:hypothetical protein
LLAKATVTSTFGLRGSICASQDPAGAPRKQACQIAALTPRLRRRRMVRSPRFDMAPSFCLPPVDFCSGVSPSQAAKVLADFRQKAVVGAVGIEPTTPPV